MVCGTHGKRQLIRQAIRLSDFTAETSKVIPLLPKNVEFYAVGQ